MSSAYYEVECNVLARPFDALPSSLPESPPGSKLPPQIDQRFLDDEGVYPAFNKAMHAAYGDKPNGIKILERGEGLTQTVKLIKWYLSQLRRESQGATADLVGAVVVSPSDITPPEDLVYGIIIENIDATPLDSVDTSSYPFPSSLGHFLMAALSSFSSYGVIHYDIRSGNILISPTRIVLIDFGEATLRGDNDDDEWWAEEVRLQDDVEALRRILNRRGIRDRSPHIHMKGYRGFFDLNRAVKPYSESWRKRWYDQDEVRLALINGKNDGKSEEPQWWTLKKEVEEWLNSRPDPPEAFKVPRPGSPKIEEDSSIA